MMSDKNHRSTKNRFGLSKKGGLNFFNYIVYTFKKEINLEEIQRSALFILSGCFTLLMGPRAHAARQSLVAL